MSVEGVLEKLEAVLQDVRSRLDRMEAHLRPTPTCLCYREAAERLGIGLTKLKSMVKRGEISATYVGRVRMVSWAEVLRVSTPPPDRPRAAAAKRGKDWQPVPKRRRG